MENESINRIETALSKPNFTIGRYPVGDSSFTQIREAGKVYVDKTAILYQMVSDSKYFFLSRPRRFGKSLMLSTLKAYFEGRKELFEGLAMGRLEKEWRRHPVISISMGHEDITNIAVLNDYLIAEVGRNARFLGVEVSGTTPALRFADLIIKTYEKYSEKAVILIDEYDKHMLDTRHKGEALHEGVRGALRGFYGCIKETADYIRFVMITGVTKFSQVSIFSGLNNLRDISLEPEYNSICGISESEMKVYFSEDMKVFAELNGFTPEEAAREFKLHYDGYRFASRGENIYNPFSTLLALQKMEFGHYWFASGTSNHLVEELKRNHYNFSKMEGMRLSAQQLMQEPRVSDTPNALLYQAGYLTIKDYRSGLYLLGFPNKEVSSGFNADLLRLLVPQPDSEFSGQLLAAYALERDTESMMEMLQLGLSRFNNMEMRQPEYEYHFKVILKVLIMAAGLTVEGEVLTPAGRIDMALTTKETIYLFEFKLDSTPDEALRQINDKDYPFKYYGAPRPIFKIGANFSTELRKLTGWIIEQAE